MRILLFYHSVVSDWNHGNAHFLRGIAGELLARGHDVLIYEPRDAWSRTNLVAAEGEGAARDVFRAYPWLGAAARSYARDTLDLDRILDGADLVVVHEWNDPALVVAIGRLRRGAPFRLLFHDTHHRSVTEPDAIGAFDLSDYDGVLVFGEVVRELYLKRGWTKEAWTWHEAADTRVFYPRRAAVRADLVWVGNWGDGERGDELRRFLLEPIRQLGLGASLHGVRWPQRALAAARDSGARYRGWIPNYRVPWAFAAHRVTVHVPRGPYVRQLPGIPTIRPFEAMACGIPLVCSPWEDSEGLFRAGEDYLIAKDGEAMGRLLRAVLHDTDLAAHLSRNGRARILARHSCAHRVDELLRIYRRISGAAPTPRSTPAEAEVAA